ncbi:helix-turn-helix transcriptional regulator [Lysinibacillus sp. FSL K6-4013]|uniref:helix-turn-helix domain-containing protein n=1 Tax=Lysinibacillus sp. FSL K6-4013 TaxID=2921504 RepID=UPI003159D877
MTKIKLKLDKQLKERKLRQKDFAEKSKLRPATISLMVNNKYDRLQLDHLLSVMQTLNITDFNEILEIIED